MTLFRANRTMLPVLAAGAVSLLLAASLAGRVVARVVPSRPPVPKASLMDPEAPPASVPSPAPLDVSDLPTPYCWTCPDSDFHPQQFQVDLDVLAPLGDGPANAAEWLRLFARGDGSRYEETAERAVRKQVGDRPWRVFPFDDPLLREAEAWVDQARCSFYPEIWQLQGADTQLPNLLFALNLARTWVARGRLSNDPEAAKQDYRRAIRMGRLLRQDDLTLIQDLVAIACIRLGAQALYDQARAEGDAVMMTATALVVTDKDAMRHFAAKRIRISTRVLESVRQGWFGGLTLETTDMEVTELVHLARRVPERRYRLQALLALEVVRHLGTEEQVSEVLDVLDELATSDDEVTAGMARQIRDEPFQRNRLEGLLESMD